MIYSKEAIRILEKLRGLNQKNEVEKALREIRKLTVNTDLSYQKIIKQCVNTEIIPGSWDPMYGIFKNTLGDFLTEKSRDEQIIILSELIIVL